MINIAIPVATTTASKVLEDEKKLKNTIEKTQVTAENPLQ
jgi:hypothetical protein